ncbi:MAG: Calx-beta domain-containing protein [Luteolibacter sp.]
MREIGIGVSSGTNGTVGPQLVTQDFGNRSSPPTFGTGVAYYDLNSNNFYDTGEGISGITVNVSGTTNYCTTAQGGGWVVPIPSTAATRTVTFSGLNMNQTANLTVPASTNAKADLKLTYSPPSITSSSSAFANIAHTITFNVVGGSSSYKWNRWTPSSAAAENCEATTNITSATTGAYSVLATTHQQGTKSFHLAMPTPVTQEIDLNGLYYGNTTPSLSFQSRLGVASTAQICKMQVKEEGGDWGDVYTQAGSGGVGEASFSLRTVSLSSMAGKAFRVRFLMVFTSGSYFNQTTDDKGWLIDAITFTNISALASNSLQTLATNSGSYTPVAAGTYLMSVAPVISGRDFPASYQTLTVAVPPPTTVSIAVSPASGAENSGTDMVFTLTRSGVTTSALTVNFSVGGTATNATDYTASGAASFTPSSGTATFPAGSATTSVTLTPMNDSLVENDETAVITLTSGMGYTVAAPSTATATIVNDDSSVSIAVSPASAAENSGTGMVFTFTRSGVITPALTVNFSVGGTATNTTDYTASGAASFTASSGTATFSAGSATTSVTLTARTDTATELSETALLTVIPGGTYTAGIPNAATATIIDSNINTSFAIWSTAFELETGLPPGTLSANPNADYDHDGRSNLVEYAFAASPTVANDPAPNMPSLQPSSTDLVLRYQIDTTRTNLTITPQACSALGNWKAPGVAGAPIGFVDSLISTTGNIVTREAKVPLTSGNPLFIRMRVTVP